MTDEPQRRWAPGTRALHAGLPEGRDLDPLLPGPVFAAPVHLRGDADPRGYGRFSNPTWERYEAALADLEGGDVRAFASGMAAVTAVLMTLLRPGDVLVAPQDAYPGVRQVAESYLHGVELRLVPSDDEAVRGAMPGATMVWIETPSNPDLRLLDIEALAEAAHDAGALLVVDGTLATPLLQQPLLLGADLSVASGTKSLSGHSDVLIGHVAARDPGHTEALHEWRTLTGSVPGPMETWLAHRGLATLDVRMERQQSNAGALAAMLVERPEVADVRWPGIGPVVAFTLPSAAAAQRFLDACELVAEATSFGGVHSTAERRARWGTDAVADGFVRFSCGVEVAEDLLADVERALDAV
jgi:cystathionine gamma-lyase